MKTFFTRCLKLLLLTTLLLLPSKVAAVGFLDQITNFIKNNNPIDPDVASTPAELLQNVIVYITGLSGVVAVAFIIYGGYLYMMAAGNQENIKKATDTIVKAVVGLVIVLVSWLIITTLIGFLD